jgi:Ca-activated chloride channel family protein
MFGDGVAELRNAMNYILSEKAEDEYIQFSTGDTIDFILFGPTNPFITMTLQDGANGDNIDDVLNTINTLNPYGGTPLYRATTDAYNKLVAGNNSSQNLSIILMTDGEGNEGSMSSIINAYNRSGVKIPVYAITFGDAVEEQLKEITTFTNGKVFDGKKDLVNAFKTVRGYN